MEHSIIETNYEALKSDVRRVLMDIGENPAREGLIDTPKRVAKMYNEIFSGYSVDPKAALGTTFEATECNEMVIVKDIQFFSHCEHHMVPFFGKVHIGYIPQGRVVGLSKLVRLTDAFAHRLQIQERLTTQIADTIDEVLSPLGVIVVIEAQHMCMQMRGVRNQTSSTVTSVVRGVLKDEHTAKAEFLSLINGR